MSETDSPDIRLGQLGPEHLEQYNDLLRYAFQVTEKELMEYGWEDDDIRQSKFPVLERAYVLGAFYGDHLASQFAVYPMKMTVHGAAYNIGFVTSVATYPEYAGMGLMSRLMKRSLTDMRERGESLALLYPYSIPLYRHKGFEIISDKMTFVVKDHQLPLELSAPGYVRRVEENSPDLFRLHGRFADRTHGCIYRNELAWEEYWRWDVDDTNVAIYYSADGEPMGYMVYLLLDEIMHIKEMIYLNPEAWKGLWKYIGAHESMVNEVKGDNYSNEPIAFWLEDSDIKETLRPYIMGRIIDVERFLGQYRFQDIKKAVSVTFDVSDPLLRWNNRSFTVALGGPEGVRVTDAPSEHRAAMEIGTLTTMLLSYKRPTYLREMERMTADRATLELLEDIIPMDKAYISDYI